MFLFVVKWQNFSRKKKSHSFLKNPVKHAADAKSYSSYKNYNIFITVLPTFNFCKKIKKLKNENFYGEKIF